MQDCPSNAVLPRITAIDAGRDRPLFSVMLPTFEPTDMLRLSLESVLRQAPSAAEMQIAVVDDGSQAAHVERLVRQVAGQHRVEVHADGIHRGMAANWNRAIALARGRLIHLLHQDDLVLPGFYSRMQRAFLRAPQIGMAFCRSCIVDARGRPLKYTSRQRWWPGILGNWLPRIGVRQRIQTPAAVVARVTYESLGGYRTDLCQTLDWEMWVRIAAHRQVWYDPKPLAVYRRHASSESARLLADGMVWGDIAHAIQVNAEAFPRVHKESLVSRSARWYAGSALRAAVDALRRHDVSTADDAFVSGCRLAAMVSDTAERAAIDRRISLVERRLKAARQAA